MQSDKAKARDFIKTSKPESFNAVSEAPSPIRKQYHIVPES